MLTPGGLGLTVHKPLTHPDRNKLSQLCIIDHTSGTFPASLGNFLILSSTE